MKRKTEASDELCFKRNYPHVDGNWSCHLYFPIPVTRNVDLFRNKCATIESKLKWLKEADVHISLSKVFTLKSFQISAFVTKLNENMKLCRLFSSK